MRGGIVSSAAEGEEPCCSAEVLPEVPEIYSTPPPTITASPLLRSQMSGSPDELAQGTKYFNMPDVELEGEGKDHRELGQIWSWRFG